MEIKAVHGVVPYEGFVCTDVKLVVAKEYSDGLDPSEVPFHVVLSPTNEVGVDVEVGVG